MIGFQAQSAQIKSEVLLCELALMDDCCMLELREHLQAACDEAMSDVYQSVLVSAGYERMRIEKNKHVECASEHAFTLRHVVPLPDSLLPEGASNCMGPLHQNLVSQLYHHCPSISPRFSC